MSATTRITSQTGQTRNVPGKKPDDEGLYEHFTYPHLIDFLLLILACALAWYAQSSILIKRGCT